MVGLAGCGPEAATQSADPRESGVVTGSNDDSGQQVRVLFDEPWLVVEGVWFIGADGDNPSFDTGRIRQPTGLLDVENDDALLFHGPALYGKYGVRIAQHQRRPAVPDWCEDVVEVAYRVGEDPLVMGSFETFSAPMEVPVGDYRVRYCATGLDAARDETAEDEFDGEDYRLYSSRHLIQLWQAAKAPAEVVRIDSQFARSQSH